MFSRTGDNGARSLEANKICASFRGGFHPRSARVTSRSSTGWRSRCPTDEQPLAAAESVLRAYRNTLQFGREDRLLRQGEHHVGTFARRRTGGFDVGFVQFQPCGFIAEPALCIELSHDNSRSVARAVPAISGRSPGTWSASWSSAASARIISRWTSRSRGRPAAAELVPAWHPPDRPGAGAGRRLGC